MKKYQNQFIYSVDGPSITVRHIIDKAIEFKYFLHSLKFNTNYHRLGLSQIDKIGKATNIPIFLDLKLYDTFTTIKKIISIFPETVKFLTITYLKNNNLEDVIHYCTTKNINVYLVGELTSFTIFDRDKIFDLCRMALYSNCGIVCPNSYLHIAKQMNINTITPGVHIDIFNPKAYTNQNDICTDIGYLISKRTIPVLGRSMPDNVDNFIQYLKN